MKSAIYSLAVGIWLANYAAAASFEGIIVANIGSDVERYLIQGNKLRIEGESSRGSKRESLILDFDAKKAFVLISNNSSLANDLWGDDITPPSRNRGIDGAPMSPRPNSKVMARATGKTATIKGYLAEQFIENFDNGRSREIWVTKQLDLAPVTTRRMREQSLIVNAYIEERLIDQGYFPLRITEYEANASSRVRYEVIDIERRKLVASLFDPGFTTPLAEKLPSRIFSSAKLVEVASLRRPTQRDTLWAYLAFELNEPSLCDKIPPHAYVSSGLFGGSLIPQIGLYRSECYLKVAERYGLQNLCDKVISIRTAYAASEYSTKNCHKKIADNKGPNSSFGQSSPDDNELISFFDALGYSPETLHLEGLAPPLSTVIDDYQILIVSQAYYKLAKEKDILERITRVTASSAFPIEQKEFLYSMAAVVARDGNWCQKIRGDIHATGQYPVDRFFRDECVTDFAYAANNPTLCSEIPNRPQYRTSFSENIIRDECRRMIEIHWNSRGDYRVPLDKNMRMAMITALGYPAPNIKEFPDHNIAEYYLGFIAKLANKNAEPSKNGEASAWQGAHEKFLKRAYALN